MVDTLGQILKISLFNAEYSTLILTSFGFSSRISLFPIFKTSGPPKVSYCMALTVRYLFKTPGVILWRFIFKKSQNFRFSSSENDSLLTNDSPLTNDSSFSLFVSHSNEPWETDNLKWYKMWEMKHKDTKRENIEKILRRLSVNYRLSLYFVFLKWISYTRKSQWHVNWFLEFFHSSPRTNYKNSLSEWICFNSCLRTKICHYFSVGNIS